MIAIDWHTASSASSIRALRIISSSELFLGTITGGAGGTIIFAGGCPVKDFAVSGAIGRGTTGT